MTEHLGAPEHEPAAGTPDCAPAVPAGALILREEAFARGVNADDIRRRLERGQWIALRPGAYLRSSTDRALTARERHLLQIEALMAVADSELVVSHGSAACLHGLDQLQIPGRAVHVTKPDATAGRRTAIRHTYCAPIDPDEIMLVNGYRVTTPARTVVDIARTRSFEDALVVADHALRLGRATRAQLQAVVDRAPRRRGMRAARQVILFADGRAASAGESRSRLLIARELLPVPELQLAIRGRTGVVCAHCDFGWPEYRTVGSSRPSLRGRHPARQDGAPGNPVTEEPDCSAPSYFDGAEKYGRGLAPGESIGDRILREKIREDRIRDLGWNVVRWTWPELEDPIMVAGRIRRALVRGGLPVGR